MLIYKKTKKYVMVQNLRNELTREEVSVTNMNSKKVTGISFHAGKEVYEFKKDFRPTFTPGSSMVSIRFTDASLFERINPVDVIHKTKIHEEHKHLICFKIEQIKCVEWQ